jgi:L-ascorbate metabolism protein UlaG (beta-lactamase superfamily)
VLGALSPPASLTADERALFEDPGAGDRFANPWGVHPDAGASAILKWKLKRNPFAAEKRSPAAIPSVAHARAGFASLPRDARIQWLGHASFFVELDDVRLVIDPIFGRAGGVVSRLAPAPLGPDDLPPIDAVLITHGHHDHCDHRSIAALVERSGGRTVCLVPRGLELPRPCVNRVELSWWQTLRLGPVQCCFVPAQHWHARGIGDLNTALWGGWVLRGSRSIYHSGDTGFFAGFGAIAKTLGPLDLAILPLGAYEPRWFQQQQHMSPEDSVRAWEALGARSFLGMHWGTFDLSDEPVTHGPQLLRRIVSERALPRERFLVVGHGGGVGFDREGAAIPFGPI